MTSLQRAAEAWGRAHLAIGDTVGRLCTACAAGAQWRLPRAEPKP